MPKRGENIRKRKDGRWEARITTQNGKRKSTYAKSYCELKQKLKAAEVSKAEEKIENLEKVISDFQKITFSQVSIKWLNETEIKNKKSTIERYRKIIQKHLIPYFENISVNKESVNLFILKKLNQDKLQAKTVYDIVTVLMQIIKYAENQEYIQNFKYDIARPTVIKKELEILSKNEQEKLVNTVKSAVTPENIGILLSLYAGLRIGEICALQWQDIDLKTGTISVTKTMQRIPTQDKSKNTKTEIIIDTPKSQKSVRKIPIPEFLRTELKKLSKNRKPCEYILTSNERYIEPRSYQYKFKKYLKQAQIRDINFHALRHTFATRAVEQKMDIKALSEILGHATINFTLEQYVHISFDFKKQNIEKLIACY